MSKTKAETSPDPKLIESPTRLSQSKLWQLQRNYFTTMGVQAWKEEVPFYVSSNALIGYQYAQLVLQAIQDYLVHHPAAKQHTFYIVELGCGTGAFGFHFLKELSSLIQAFELRSIKIGYLFTDLIEKNVEFCEKQIQAIDNFEIDFACFNVEKDDDFYLRKKKINYSALHHNPLFIIANYTFDCITQDAFHCIDNKMQEMKVGITSRYKNYDTEKALHLNDLRFNYAYANIECSNYYDDPAFNQILSEYLSAFQDKKATFMIPLGALNFIRTMNQLTSGRFFLLVGDKGVSNYLNYVDISDNARMTYDGCYSFLVNFDAISRYMKQLNGSAHLTQKYSNFKINLYWMGVAESSLVNTIAVFKNQVEGVGPDEYCLIYDEFLTNGYRFSAKALISFLRLSRWDPSAYAIIHDKLIDLIPLMDYWQVEELKQDMIKVENNIYPIGIGDDFYKLLGVFYQVTEDYDRAMALYHQSISTFGENVVCYHNMGIIYEKQKNTAKAIECYQKAVLLDKNDRFSNRKIMTLSGKPTRALIEPMLKVLGIGLLLALALYLIKK